MPCCCGWRKGIGTGCVRPLKGAVVATCKPRAAAIHLRLIRNVAFFSGACWFIYMKGEQMDVATQLQMGAEEFSAQIEAEAAMAAARAPQ